MKKAIILILLFGFLLVTGIFNDEFVKIYQHAIILCLACIGIG